MTEEFPVVSIGQIYVGDSIKVENSDKSAFAVGYVQAIKSETYGNPFIALSTADPKVGGLTWWVGENDTYWKLSEGAIEPQEPTHWWDEQMDGQSADVPTHNVDGTGDAEFFRVTKKSHNHYVVVPYYDGKPFDKPKHLNRDEWVSIFDYLGRFNPVDRRTQLG